MTSVINITTKEPIKKCDRCFHNEAVMSGGIMRKKFNYCSRYCSAKENIFHRIFVISAYIFVLYLIRYEILPDLVLKFLDTSSSPLWDFSFGEILSFGILSWLILFIFLFVNSLAVLRKGKMEWIRLTFEEHLKLKSEKVYALHEQQEF